MRLGGCALISRVPSARLTRGMLLKEQTQETEAAEAEEEERTHLKSDYVP